MTSGRVRSITFNFEGTRRWGFKSPLSHSLFFFQRKTLAKRKKEKGLKESLSFWAEALFLSGKKKGSRNFTP